MHSKESNLWQILLQGAEGLLSQCISPPSPALLPDAPILLPSGGQLVHVLSGHTEYVSAITLSKNSKYAVTCEYVRGHA